MSHRDDDGTVWIAAEPDGRCELCGTTTETRPYGPGFAEICADCADLDLAGSQRRMAVVLFGDEPTPDEAAQLAARKSRAA